jgi:hypothetical protein
MTETFRVGDHVLCSFHYTRPWRRSELPAVVAEIMEDRIIIEFQQGRGTKRGKVQREAVPAYTLRLDPKFQE